MGKKQSSSVAATDLKSKEESVHHEIRGLAYLLLSMLIMLSLVSFTCDYSSKNWLGFIGFSIGWLLHYFLGVTSFLVPFGLGWIGWRMLFSKTINRLRGKVIAFSLIVIALSILFNLFDDGSVVPHYWGGKPLYFIHHEMPWINLSNVLNTTGVVVICLGALLAGFLYLSKLRLSHTLVALRARLLKPKNAVTEPTLTDKPQEIQKEKAAPESDFMRYVKLRIPGQTGAQQQSADIPPPPYSPYQDMLAIQPEKNLTARPAVSRKSNDDVVYTASSPTGWVDPAPQMRKKEPTASKAEPKVEPKIELAIQKREAALKAQRVHNGDFKEFVLPPINLLTSAKKFDQSSLKKDLKKQAEVLEETLQSFGIEAKVGQINCGPTITSFEVHPAIGVKVQKIRTLENDIALNMEAKSIRIIAPIPGKAAVGIEVPNPQPQEVSFKEMLTAYQQGTQKLHIPVLLGKAVNGDYVMSDLAKMPHCIIAGATGSGKSVCINTIIMSIVMNAKPDQIKLLMVDPKKVELTPYSHLPHMIAPVITEPKGACAALNWLVKEMEKRYEILKQLGVRNIEAFNNRKADKDKEASLDLEVPDKMFYIVGIIDELADLMMVASSDIETPIARIAQMARAVGIHLILATQRPSREAYLVYQKSVVLALTEAESALVAYFNEQERLSDLHQKLEATRRSLELNSDLYEAGLINYLDWIQSKQLWLNALSTLVDSEQALAVDLVGIYKSLGGDW